MVLPLLAAFASVANAQTAPDCAVSDPTGVYPSTLSNYPVPSGEYAVQYKLGAGPWTEAMVYISKYGGAIASPYHKFSGYPEGKTSMSFVSIPAGDQTAVGLRVTRLSGSGFPASDHVSVRPRARGVRVDSVTRSTVELSTKTGEGFGGEQFILWWDGGDPEENGGIQGLAFFLDPHYDGPVPGANVKTITRPEDFTGLGAYDTLDFKGIVGGKDDVLVFTVPSNITTVFLEPGSWIRGKMRFEETGKGAVRRLYGSGVLDASRFDYRLRQCRKSTDPSLRPEGYEALSFVEDGGVPDQFHIDGIVIADYNFFSTSSLRNTFINDMKIIGWNGNNDGFEFGLGTRASNVFVRTGDDSLKMWDSSVTITNATVWQNFNGGVVNLGWGAGSLGEDSLIDGLYVVKTDWQLPEETSWIYNPKNPLNGQNNGIIASMMIPGTEFGKMHPSVYRNIYVEDTPRVLFSLKILPPDCDLVGVVVAGKCEAFDPSATSVLNLRIENFFSPASVLENSIGFQTLDDGVTTLTGTMNIRLNNVFLTLPDGTLVRLDNQDAGFAGKIGTNGGGIDIDYGGADDHLDARGWFSAWTAAQAVYFPGSNLPGTGDSTVRMIVRPVISGDAVRVKLENTFGGSSVTFSSAFIGQLQSGAALVPGSNRQLTFNDGSFQVTLAPGTSIYSDPLTFAVSAFTRYAISLDVSGRPGSISGHTLGLVTNYMAAGARAADPSGAGFSIVPSPDKADPQFPVYWVAALDVASKSATGTVVALGDSITDGRCSTRDDTTGKQVPDLYNRWTDVLATRFALASGDRSKAVVNEGIAGNTIFGDESAGPPALVRLENDVLFREGLTHVIFLEGTNDIGFDVSEDHVNPDVLLTSLIAADQLVIARAHTAGVKIAGATILPRGSDAGWTLDMENVRVALNDWIRHRANFDGVIDFDVLMSVPGKTGIPMIRPDWSCGDLDGVHPNAKGYSVMGAAIDLGLFRTPED
jgi:lysophospholipase L1-like esterase